MNSKDDAIGKDREDLIRQMQFNLLERNGLKIGAVVEEKENMYKTHVILNKNRR